MARPYFYNATTKKMIVAFATLFDGIRIQNDHDEMIGVPIVFSQKEKFIDDINQNYRFDPDKLTKDYTLPRMGFELTGMNFAPERHTHQLNRIVDYKNEQEALTTYNRVAYDFTFDLFIASKRLEDGLKIVEQIVPFFAPHVNMTVKDAEGINLQTNIIFTLNSVAHDFDYEGTMDNSRTIMWTLNFTCKTHFYANNESSPLINQIVLDYHDLDTLERLERILINSDDLAPLEPPIIDPCDQNIWGGDAYSTGDDL